MKKILLHDQCYSIGGPKAVLDSISNSYLKDKYEFVRLKQTEACGFNPIKAIRFVNKYRKLINKEHADGIYICGLQYAGLLMTIASKFSNVRKVILSVHGSDWDNPDGSFRKWILMHIVEPLEIRLADSVITVCENAQRTIKPLQRCKHNDGVVYNTFPSVDYDSVSSGKLRHELEIGTDKIIVTSVGRVVEAKGHAEIIRAMKDIGDDSFVFVIVGDGPYLEQYKAECQQQIKEKRLFLLGQRHDVNEILKDSDIFLFASHNENHSIALLEAVNMHCPVLCTNVGGNSEIIENGISGVTFEKGNVEGLIDGLHRVVANSERYAMKAFETGKRKFSTENTLGKLERIFG